jgi:hypothetical protein
MTPRLSFKRKEKDVVRSPLSIFLRRFTRTNWKVLMREGLGET